MDRVYKVCKLIKSALRQLTICSLRTCNTCFVIIQLFRKRKFIIIIIDDISLKKDQMHSGWLGLPKGNKWFVKFTKWLFFLWGFYLFHLSFNKMILPETRMRYASITGSFTYFTYNTLYREHGNQSS